MEIKSALWQKLFMLPISLLFCAVGIAAFVSPFVPAMHTTSRTGQVIPPTISDLIIAPVLGLFMLALGGSLWWAVVKYSIRADNEGITQTNGFFRQSVRWADVAAYYVATNPRHHKEQRLHVEPIMLSAEGKIVFQGFAHLLVSTQKTLEQRRQLWRFVEAQLKGKKVHPPSPTPKATARTLAIKSLEVDWAKKSSWWKVARILALLLYGLFWTGILMGPIYYMVVHNIKPPRWTLILLAPMFYAPLLPHLMWLKWKERQIAKSMQQPESKTPFV
jgi:hypothetical protein